MSAIAAIDKATTFGQSNVQGKEFSNHQPCFQAKCECIDGKIIVKVHQCGQECLYTSDQILFESPGRFTKLDQLLKESSDDASRVFERITSLGLILQDKQLIPMLSGSKMVELSDIGQFGQEVGATAEKAMAFGQNNVQGKKFSNHQPRFQAKCECIDGEIIVKVHQLGLESIYRSDQILFDTQGRFMKLEQFLAESGHDISRAFKGIASLGLKFEDGQLIPFLSGSPLVRASSMDII